MTLAMFKSRKGPLSPDVTCPGVYLARRDDIYLNVCLFGQVRRTQLTGPIFPLIFHEKFKFDKVFYTAYSPSQVANALEDEPVIIELVQFSDSYTGGKLLAYYECNARDFFYPYPTYSPTYGTQDRDILLERSLDFPGISPRLEFSTKTIISETSSPLLSDFDDDVVYVPRSPRHSRSRNRSPKRSKGKSLAYGRPTVSSISRARSLSPSMRTRFETLSLDEESFERPPFVVRKVQSRKLTGRDPGTPSPKQKIRCMHGTYSNNSQKTNKSPRDRSPEVCVHCNKSMTEKNCTLCKAFMRYTGKWYWGHENGDHPHNHITLQGYNSSDDVVYLSEPDSDLLDLTTYRPRYRSPSPVYTTTLSDRYLGRPLSPTRSEIISAQVDRAIERNRTAKERLERLDRLYPYSSYRYQRDLTALDELELDLQLSRRSRNSYLYY